MRLLSVFGNDGAAEKDEPPRIDEAAGAFKYIWHAIDETHKKKRYWLVPLVKRWSLSIYSHSLQLSGDGQ